MTVRSQARLTGATVWMIVQTTIVLFIMTAALFAPPARGSILLVPLTPAARSALLSGAIAHGARLEGAGPVAGSVVVQAERAALAPAMRAAGVLMIAARPVLCGPIAGGRA